MGRTGPTGWEVARAANVSQSTVSLVLSGLAVGRVAPETQERVRQVALKLGYRPNAVARSLRLGRSGLVLLVVPEVQNPFFSRVLDGAQRAAHATGSAVVLGSAPITDDLFSPGSAVDGIILCSIPLPELCPTTGHVPVVALDTTNQRGVPTVRLDVADGMAAAVHHLVGLGHSRICHFAAQQRTSTFAARAQGFRRAAAGLRARTVRLELTVEAAEEAARTLLTPQSRVTAVVCDDDILAAGIYRAARQLGIDIPDQLSVIGFGNTQVARMLYPSLTTVDLPGEDLGGAGVRALLSLRDGQTPATRSMLPTRLLIRDSTASVLVGQA